MCTCALAELMPPPYAGTTCMAAIKPSERTAPPLFMMGAKRCTHDTSEYDDADIAAM